MSLITTRQNQQDQTTTWVIDQLLDVVTSYGPSNTALFNITPSSDREVIEGLLKIIKNGIEANSLLALTLIESNDDLDFENSRLRDVLNTQQKFMADLVNVRYDDALDHATLDFMDALVSNGSTDVSEEGNILFDSRTELTKGDLKPMVREGISRWIRCKIE